MRKTHWLTRALAVSILLAAAPLTADDRPWQVKGSVMFIDGGTSVRSGYDDQSHVTIDGYGGGLYAALEYRPTPRLGIELGHLLGAVGNSETHFRHGDRQYYTDTDGIGFSSLLFALNVHLTPGQRVDVSIGPVIGYVWFSEFDVDWVDDDTVTVAIGSELAWGGALDIGIPIAQSNWSININMKYLDTKVESHRYDYHSSLDSSFDPFMVGVGFGFRF